VALAAKLSLLVVFTGIMLATGMISTHELRRGATAIWVRARRLAAGRA
jgi:hypothetical protein